MGSRLRVALAWAPRPLALLIAPLVACVVLAACGGSAHKQTHRSSAARTHTSTRASSTIRPIATVTEHLPLGPETLRVMVYDLRRSGAFLTLDFGVVCESQNGYCSGSTEFVQPATTADELKAQGSSAGGIRLLDPAGDKQYAPVLDSHGRPESADLSNIAHPPNATLAWVTFPAPPASVSSLDVLLPNGGPAIQDVPISSGAAPTPTEVGPGTQAAGPSPFAPPAAGSTVGLTLPVYNLILTVGNPAGSDSESGSQATLTLRADVLFHFNKSNLTAKAAAIIGNVATKIKSRAVGPVQVTGYTDSIGTDAVNIPLSQARAQAVVGALRRVTPGITYNAAGLGSADPVAQNTKADGSDNPAGRALNRRVTITLHVKAPAKPAPPPQSTPAVTTPAPAGSAQTLTYHPTTTSLGTSTYAVTVYHLYREGNLALLELTFTCQSSTISGNSCDTEYEWAGTPTAPPAPAFNAFNDQLDVQLDTLSGVYLTSPATGSIYVPVIASDGSINGSVLTSRLDSQTAAGITVSAWIYFPAPAGSSATVNLPGGSPQVPGVPIAAPSP